MAKNIIPIGEFKTHCYKLLDESNKNHTKLTITKRGKVIAQVIPFDDSELKKTPFFGSMKDIASINGDIVAPIDTKWNVENE